MKLPEKFKVLVITLSDRVHNGVYKDLSGPAVVKYVKYAIAAAGWECEINTVVLPDDAASLRNTLAASTEMDLIITTGGTGLGPRDMTTDVIKPLLTKEIPGVMELIRVKYGMKNPNALLSRSVAGVTGKTLIYTLPGSVKAVHEYMAEIVKTMEHTFYMLYGIDKHSH